METALLGVTEAPLRKEHCAEMRGDEMLNKGVPGCSPKMQREEAWDAAGKAAQTCPLGLSAVAGAMVPTKGPGGGVRPESDLTGLKWLHGTG